MTFAPMRPFGSAVHNCCMSLAAPRQLHPEKLAEQAKLKLAIALKKSSVFPVNKGLPDHSSKRTQPSAHQSTAAS